MLKKIAVCTQSAIAAGVFAALIAMVLSTSHQGRIDVLFNEAAKRFLAAFKVSKDFPDSKGAQDQLMRAKATLDLIRARKGWIGQRRPSISDCIDLFDGVKTQFAQPHLRLVAKLAA